MMNYSIILEIQYERQLLKCLTRTILREFRDILEKFGHFLSDTSS